MSNRRDELPSIDLNILSHVTGGAGMDMSSMMMPMMMMMQKKHQAAPAPAPAPAAPATPQISLNGVPQSPSSIGATGTNFTMPSFGGDDASDF